jgi:hypothetical protein
MDQIKSLTFTDDNFKRLKDILNNQFSRDKINPGIFIDELKDLLARTEAGELYNKHRHSHDGADCGTCVIFYEAWRKAAGKSLTGDVRK